MDEQILSVLTNLRRHCELLHKQNFTGKLIIDINWNQGGIGEVEITKKEKVK